MNAIDFEEMIPKGILFSIKDINEMGLIKSDMLKKLIYNRAITVVKIGSKNFIPRNTLIEYLVSKTILAQL